MERSESLNQLDIHRINLSGGCSQAHPSKDVSQFKAPLMRQSGVQPNKPLEPNLRASTPASTPSKGVPQFKAPLMRQSGAQPNKPLEPSLHASTLTSTSSKGDSQFKVPLMRHSSIEQGQPSSALGVPPFNGASLLAESTQPLPSIHVTPSVRAHATYSADPPVTPHNSILATYPTYIPITPHSGIPDLLSPLGGQRKRPSPQSLRKPDQSWQPARPWSEVQVKPQALHSTKTGVTVKIMLLGGITIIIGGIASFLLLRFPTYLVVTWVVLIIIFSNLVSQELRSSYRLTLTTLRRIEVQPSSHSDPMGRNPLLKDISDTTGYLKALSLVFKHDRPLQTIPAERQHKG